MTDWIPDSLRAVGPAGLTWLQWIAVGGTAPLAFILATIFARGLQWGVRRLTWRTHATLDDELLDAYAGPVRLLIALGIIRLALPFFALPPEADRMAIQIVLAGLAAVVVWSTLRTIDVVVRRTSDAEWVKQRPSSRSLLLLLGRIGKVVVVVIAMIMVLGSMGLPVSSLLAGLGIGGIALAFGAQKTVENVFGAIALGVDQPLREGDFVRIEDNVLGTVESLGLRSSRIRTLDRTVVALPNGRLSDMRIETFAVRDRCRLSETLGVVYATSARQLRAILDGFETVLRSHPKIWPDDVVVKFAKFGESSLDIEIMAWFQTGDYGEFRAYRQDVLLGFMDVVEREGSSFAFPTRTVHIEQR
ncbi:MAG: mechanosensitive ion channel family protein [Kofleriaceae bacterium]|nr:mechanosensitive ion channel family protein [Kofleriaceae bacterium]